MGGKGKTFLLLALSFLASFAFMEAANFDYFAFVLQWPPASCQKVGLPTPCPMFRPNRFTIRGLWPQLNSSGLIVNCPGLAFDITKIKDLVTHLSMYWPNVLQRHNNERFWEHEWRQHGTCWVPDNQLKYFKKALDLLPENDILKILNDAGLGPSGKNCFGQQMKDALKRKLKGSVEPALRCITDAAGQKQMNEIVLCYKNDAVTPINCPTKLTNCPDNFLWHPRNSTTFADDLEEAMDLGTDSLADY